MWFPVITSQRTISENFPEEIHFHLIHYPRSGNLLYPSPSHHSPSYNRHLHQLGTSFLGVPSCKKVWRTQVTKLKSLEIKFRSFCHKFSLSPILRSWTHSSSRSSESGVGLELLVALFRAFLPGISASTAVMSGSHRAEYSLSPILLSWAANSGASSAHAAFDGAFGRAWLRGIS